MASEIRLRRGSATRHDGRIRSLHCHGTAPAPKEQAKLLEKNFISARQTCLGVDVLILGSSIEGETYRKAAIEAAVAHDTAKLRALQESFDANAGSFRRLYETETQTSSSELESATASDRFRRHFPAAFAEAFNWAGYGGLHCSISPHGRDFNLDGLMTTRSPDLRGPMRVAEDDAEDHVKAGGSADGLLFCPGHSAVRAADAFPRLFERAAGPCIARGGRLRPLAAAFGLWKSRWTAGPAVVEPAGGRPSLAGTVRRDGRWATPSVVGHTPLYEQRPIHFTEGLAAVLGGMHATDGGLMPELPGKAVEPSATAGQSQWP